MSPEQLVEWAIAYGFTAIAVTDHNTIHGGLRAKEYARQRGYSESTIVVIPGVEYTYGPTTSVTLTVGVAEYT